MKINAYLTFDDSCEAAFNYYAEHLGGTIVDLMRVGEAPPMEEGAPPYAKPNNIMHATMTIGDGTLMGSDAMDPYCPYVKSQGISVALHPESVAEAERVFAVLSEGGQVTMPLERTFWAVRFGTVTDRFGVPWMINCEKE